MSDKKDSGRFVFNKDNKRNYVEGRENNPSKPDNMDNQPNNKDGQQPSSLYTYSMGISEIQANNSSYEERNIYVSKPIKINENILEIGLSALEEHPAFDDISGRASKQQTSVEYFMSLNDNPTTDDWIPILPTETKVVYGERLFFNGVNAKTLFPFKMHTIVLYEDGVKVEDDKYHVLNTQEVQVIDINSSRVYTIDYEPHLTKKDPYKIEVNDYKYKVEKIKEVFPKGTDSNKKITLKHVPYIDREELLRKENFSPNTSFYQPVEVRITNASIRNGIGGSVSYVPPYEDIEGNPYMVNKTLYLDNSWSDMEKFSVEKGQLGINYYQHKNKITFADHINIPMIEENEFETPGTGTIEVSYDALVTEFRFKIILRRNTQKEITATPRVKEYELKFKSVR